MITQQEIIDFCARHDYDIRKTGNGRWIDQKCTPDVVTAVAECIRCFCGTQPEREFTVRDIWYSDYAARSIEAVFKKPGVKSKAAVSEYDKFFSQPLEMLASAGVLLKVKRKGRNIYRIVAPDILEYIALREKNALFFLKTYIEEVLSDSGLTGLFDEFFAAQTKDAYKRVKKGFSEFTRANTRIKKYFEPNRIFTKIINTLAYFRNSRGTKKGHLSKRIITYDMLMYNRDNFRDLYSEKPKGMTRKEYAALHKVEPNNQFYRYQSEKARHFLRLFNDENRAGQPEFPESRHADDHAIHMHHIFPERAYPEISHYLENLIALTPTQHLVYAHPNGKTKEIDEQYQHLLLLSKADRIHENLTDAAVETIYEFANLLYVLNVGFDDDALLTISDMDFGAVVLAINLHYAA